MTRNPWLPAAILAFLLAFAGVAPSYAGAEPAATPAAGSGPAATADDDNGSAEESRRLHEVLDAYFEEYLELNPLLATSIGVAGYNGRYEVQISPEWRARDESLQTRYLERIKGIDHRKLGRQDLISWEVFKSAREMDIEGFRFPSWLIPLNQFYSVPNSFVQLGSGSGIQPFKTVKDYEDFLQRMDGLPAWTDQAIANMRDGVAKGYTLPRVLAEKVLPQLASQVVARPDDSLFWNPVKNMPVGFSDADRARLTAAYRSMIATKVFPTYSRLHDFIRDEYLPKCRESVGMEGLPDGKAWYEYRVREITTTDRTPAEIHALGLAEVERIHGEIREVMQRVGFKGDMQAFFTFLRSDPKFYFDSADALIGGYDDIRKRVNPRLPELFEVLPKADYEVRAVEPFREKSAAGGQYQAASEDGSRPGIFYANTYDLKARPNWAMEALSLHEANPGHHFQISIQREQRDLPGFRRFGGYTAYSEGWALYAESLGKPLGMYQDPYQYFGMLEGELWRSIRLVVDTGLHSMGWSRKQVLDYMAANSATAEARSVAEAERYMAIPGQALAYKIGQLEIRALRAKAERELGAKFDLRRFHTAVLIHGALPLRELSAEIERWIAGQRGG